MCWIYVIVLLSTGVIISSKIINDVVALITIDYSAYRLANGHLFNLNESNASLIHLLPFDNARLRLKPRAAHFNANNTSAVNVQTKRSYCRCTTHSSRWRDVRQSYAPSANLISNTDEMELKHNVSWDLVFHFLRERRRAHCSGENISEAGDSDGARRVLSQSLIPKFMPSGMV